MERELIFIRKGDEGNIWHVSVHKDSNEVSLRCFAVNPLIPGEDVKVFHSKSQEWKLSIPANLPKWSFIQVINFPEYIGIDFMVERNAPVYSDSIYIGGNLNDYDKPKDNNLGRHLIVPYIFQLTQEK